MENALYNAYGTRQVSQIYAPNNQYQVIMRVAPQFQRDPAAMSLLHIRSSSGRLIPLESVARMKTEVGPFQVNHFGQLPAVTIAFNLAPGFALGDAVTQIQSMAASTLPATINLAFQGTAQAFQDSLRGLGLVLLMAIVVIYIVLGVLYESFTHPLTILSGLPAAGLGALLTLMIFKTELNLYAFVGVIMLVGLVKKNGIMMVDFAVDLQRQGKSAGRGDSRGLSRPLPADHDDDDGGAGGDAADCARARCGCRIAPAAGSGRGRRAAGLAAADALHHARVLRLYRRRPRPSDASSPCAPASRGGSGCALANFQLPTPKYVLNWELGIGGPELGVGRWELSTDLLDVPVPGDAEANPAKIESVRRCVEPAVAHLRADRELRHAGE